MVLFLPRRAGSASANQRGLIRASTNRCAEGRARDAKAAFARAFQLDREATVSLLRRFTTEGKPNVAEHLLSHLRELVSASPALVTPAAP